jgi:hypothetical protein
MVAILPGADTNFTNSHQLDEWPAPAYFVFIRVHSWLNRPSMAPIHPATVTIVSAGQASHS